jgi:DNA-binding NarL/FixJ family response regulator
VPRRLLVVQDDVFFGARVQAAARRLGLEAELVSPRDLEARAREAGTVVVMQLTLRPERQLELLRRLRGGEPAATVVAVSGHLETGLRRRARLLGARLATHSGLDRALARAAALSDDPGGPDDPDEPGGPDDDRDRG